MHPPSKLKKNAKRRVFLTNRNDSQNPPKNDTAATVASPIGRLSTSPKPIPTVYLLLSHCDVDKQTNKTRAPENRGGPKLPPALPTLSPPKRRAGGDAPLQTLPQGGRSPSSEKKKKTERQSAHLTTVRRRGRLTVLGRSRLSGNPCMTQI